jgi:hypothetical protein
MKIFQTVASTLLMGASLVWSDSLGPVVQNGRFDLTAAMRSKILSVAHRFLLDEEEGLLDETTRVVSLRRKMAIGEFDEFNQLFQNATILLPDAQVSDRVAFIKLKIKLREMYCEDMSVGDIVITHNKQSNQRLTFKVDIVDLAMNCYGKFNFEYGFIGGGGTMEANSGGSSASTVLAFTSRNFDLEPPGDSTVASCAASINIYNMEFRGGLIPKLLDISRKIVANKVEDEVEGCTCTF